MPSEEDIKNYIATFGVHPDPALDDKTIKGHLRGIREALTDASELQGPGRIISPAMQIQERVATLEAMARRVELVLFGPPAKPVELNHPQPPPPEPGLVGKVAKIWRFLHPMRHPYSIDTSTLSGEIDHMARERIAAERWRDDRDRENRTLRGRIKTVAKKIRELSFRSKQP